MSFAGHIDHSARVIRVITWNKSIRGMHNANDKKDGLDAEDYETHATVLDKLLAWEKKLYDEVKVHFLFCFIWFGMFILYLCLGESMINDRLWWVFFFSSG